MMAQILLWGRVTDRGVLVFKKTIPDLPITAEFSIRDMYTRPHPITGHAITTWEKWTVQCRGITAQEVIDTVVPHAYVFIDGRPTIRRVVNRDRTKSHAIRLVEATRVQVIEGPGKSYYQMLAEQGDLPWHDPKEWEEHPQRELLEQTSWNMGKHLSNEDLPTPDTTDSAERCASSSPDAVDPSCPPSGPASPSETDSP